jgi:MtN3 and saliva related transmembrane protein
MLAQKQSGLAMSANSIRMDEMDIKRIYSYYMSVVGVLGQLMFFIQAYKIFATKSAGDLSLVAFMAALISVASWLVYGIMIKDKPLIIANIVACVGAVTVIVGVLLYS